MTVIVEQSVCKDCFGIESCMRLKRLNPGMSLRDNMEKLYEGVHTSGDKSEEPVYKRQGRSKETFEIVIVKCSMKEQYETRLKMRNIKEEVSIDKTLFYCTICLSMHKRGSKVGVEHTRLMGVM